ncbi:MAG: hypothetical protein SGBAC_007258 [Bacillariaceae sp.]
MKQRINSLQRVDEDKVCVSPIVDRNEISHKKRDSMKRGLSTRQNKKKKKVNKFKDKELNKKYELLPKKARKAPFGRCYFAFHRESNSVVLIAMIFQKVFDQFVEQGGRGEDELHELMKAADPNLRGLREKIQCIGAIALVMDISSNETTETATTTATKSKKISAANPTSSDAASIASEEHATTKEIITTSTPTPKSEANHSHKRVEETETDIDMTGYEEAPECIQHEAEFSTNPAECISSIAKENEEDKENRPQETTIDSSPEPQKSSWASWFMPWTRTKQPPSNAENQIQIPSDRELFQAEASSLDPYDKMKQDTKTIKSKYYQGEAWSVVSQGYSDCDVSSRAPNTSIAATLDSLEAIKGIRGSEIKTVGRLQEDIPHQSKNSNESHEMFEYEAHQQRSTRRVDPEGSHQVDPSFSATLKGTHVATEPGKGIRSTTVQALETRKASRKGMNVSTQPGKRASITEVFETTKLPQNEIGNAKPNVRDETRKPALHHVTRIAEKDTFSRVSTEYTKDTRTIYSADYSSVAPYTLRRPRNLTLCGLLCSLELADCMPLGPYGYDYTDYDEIFSVDDVQSYGGNRRQDTSYSGDSRSSV